MDLERNYVGKLGWFYGTVMFCKGMGEEMVGLDDGMIGEIVDRVGL